ncbi:hypothetical protein [Kordiimonas sp.]|uniref:hypothetical protein n=1 Tax=Kordiimonas sp. TaxID=1970157 RepID=UPI003A8E4D2C
MSSLAVFPKNAAKAQRLHQFLQPRASSYQELDVPGFPALTLVLWAADRASTALFLPLDGNDFIAVTGTLFVAGQTGPEAARALHESFDAASFDWTDCTGQFVAVIGKAGKLHMVNDGLGSWKLYSDTDGSFASAGFLEASLLKDSLSFNAQGVYEYAFTGFVLGEATFVNEITAVMPHHLLAWQGGAFKPIEKPTPIKATQRNNASFDDMLELQLTALRARFSKFATLPPDAVTSSVSGGFDSRLMIALLKEAGLRPNLFVYGADDDEDVPPSKALADYFGLPLNHVDRGTFTPPEHLPTVEDVLYYFDGWKDDGLADFEHDITDRKNRAASASYMANGKCGEIYRHYYYQHVGKRGINLNAFVRGTFGRHVPQMVTACFDRHSFEANVTRAFRALTGFDGTRLSQEDLDYLYPKVRICFDAGRDITVNHRFSHALYPFAEAELSGPALALNYEERLYGKLEAHVIAAIDPELINIPSAYGYDLLKGPGLAYRLKMAASYHRPTWLRTAVPALKTMLSPASAIDMASLPEATLITDKTMPAMQRYFNLDRVCDRRTASRIYALEVLAQYVGITTNN